VPEVRIQALPSWDGGAEGGGGGGGLFGWLSLALRRLGVLPAGEASGAERAAEAAAVPFLILACDGVWDVISNEEAADFVGRDVAAACAAAAAAAAGARGGGAEAEAAAARAAAAAHLGGTAERLRHLVLARTAAEVDVPTRTLLLLRPGKGGRRDVHDDITVVVNVVGGVDAVVGLAARAASVAQPGPQLA
jgi:hypothetical protein